MLKISKPQTTMIGSVPCKSSSEALSELAKSPLTIPAWPQLPLHSYREGMLVQYSMRLPGLKIDDKEKKTWIERDDSLLDSMSSFYEDLVNKNISAFALTEEFAAGFTPFVKQFAGSPKKQEILKGQVVGPFTLGLGVSDSDGRALWFDEQYRDIIINTLIQNALWQVSNLKKHAEQVVIFFDEPIFSALGTPAYMGISDEDVTSVLNSIADEIHNAGAAVGVHCCGNMDWSLLAKSYIDIISFDAYFYGEKVLLYAEDINNFLSRGGYLAWGIVPTNDSALISSQTVFNLREKMSELKKKFIAKKVDEKLLDSNMLITPACGMGNLSIEDARKVLGLLRQLVE